MTIIYNGKKYTCVPNHKDKRRRYLASTTNRGEKYLHRQVWIDNFGQIPKGYHIHHKDENIYNNDIANLACISRVDHFLEHKEQTMSWSRSEENKKNLRKHQPKASLWMKTDEAKRHFRQIGKKNALNSIVKRTCATCESEFDGCELIKEAKFCSKKCKSIYFGKQKKTINCVVCGKSAEIYKYSKSKACSMSCTNTKKYKEVINENSRI